MNKNLYRIVFNKARGMLMVVADIARSGNVQRCTLKARASITAQRCSKDAAR